MIVLTYLHLINRLAADRRGERGAGLVEYTMLLILIVVVCIAAITLLGNSTNSSYSEISSQLG